MYLNNKQYVLWSIFNNFGQSLNRMKKTILLLMSVVPCLISGQEHFCAKSKASSAKHTMSAAAHAAANPLLSHEMKYDVKFVHLNLNVERTNLFISGGVKTVATVTATALDTFMTLLHQNYTIDSVRINGALLNSLHVDSIVKVKLPSPLANGSTFTAQVYYNGTAPGGNVMLQSGLNNDDSWWSLNNDKATWSLSESLVAYHWWPCKQVLTDKIDSSWVFITTDSTNKAGSNGILTNVVNVGNKKRYEWKSHKPIAYYLISVAVAKFKEYKQYAKPQYLSNDSILILNYIDQAAYNTPYWIQYEKPALDSMPLTINLFSNLYGMYPFYKEKYGHCHVPVGGGMEHQTMTTMGFFSFWIDAHELGHQWWGDNVTCKSWGDIWINEGFASYSEHLANQYLTSYATFTTHLNNAHTNVMGQSGGSCYFTGADTMNVSRIFDSRLTYDKGGAIIHTLRFVTNNDSLWFGVLRGFQNTYKNKTASVTDFKNYYHTFTGIDPTQFFNQWFYGEGFPIFTVRYNYNGTQCIIKSQQTVSKASVTPLFLTPMEYKIKRKNMPDTVVRVMHNNSIEVYNFNLTGTVTSVVCDPNNWVINKTQGPFYDTTITGFKNYEIVEAGIRLGPNPTKGQLSLINSNSIKGSVKVSDQNGRVIQSLVLEDYMNIDLSGSAVGIYFISVYDSSNKPVVRHKIIKQ